MGSCQTGEHLDYYVPLLLYNIGWLNKSSVYVSQMQGTPNEFGIGA